MLELKAAVLGVVEGATEFLPISSTGHLIVASSIVDYPENSRAAFDVFIQMGAILAVVWHYRRQLWELVRGLPGDSAARALAGTVLLACVPAMAAGYLWHRAIETHLFSPTAVAVTLILGGVLLIVVERGRWDFRVDTVEDVHWHQGLGIGVAQMLSLVPGVSRAGATIIGGMFVGLSRPAATQFSFYLSIPTLCAAAIYSLYAARAHLSVADVSPMAVGLSVSFISALIVVRAFIAYVQRHDFTGFGYYRIAVGALILFFFR